MDLTVCKFGGTSLAEPENIKRVCSIIRADPRRRIIVVSAPGKRDPNDTKITDLLLRIYDLKEAGMSYDKPFNEFSRRFYEIERAFNLNTDLREVLAEFYRELQHQNMDFIASTGEYFMAKIMAAILGFEFLDLDKVHIMLFDKNGDIDIRTSRFNFEPYLSKRVVIPGFYGIKAEDGSVKTFPRGGSDISGAVIANIADATLYENWTDVDGVYDKDPRRFNDARKYDLISYNEVEELARNGANVLHPDCIHYVREKEIPIHLKNTFNPYGKGTIIRTERRPY